MNDRKKAHALMGELEDLSIHQTRVFDPDPDEWDIPLFDVRLDSAVASTDSRQPGRVWRLRVVPAKVRIAKSYELTDVVALAQKYGAKVAIANNGLELT